MAASFGGATSARKIAVKRPIGTPISTARLVPTIDVRIIKRIPKLGSDAVGFHTVPNRISRGPTSKSAGVPLMITYAVIYTTARTATRPQTVTMMLAAFSTADFAA